MPDRSDQTSLRTPTVRRPARVLFLHSSNELYGSDLVLLNLLRGLDQRYIHPIVLVPNDMNYDGLFSRELASSGIDCRPLPIAVARRKYFTPTGLFGFFRKLQDSAKMVSKIIRDEHIDLVHSNTLAVWTGAMAARRSKRPHLWHVHELIERPPQLNTFMRRFAPSHSTKIISVCQAGLDHLLVNPHDREKGIVLYNGLDGQQWMTATGRERIRQELGCGPEDVLFGMVARLSSFKAPDLFVKAVTQLIGQNPRIHCFIAGGPVPGQTAMLEEVQALIAASPAPERIHLLGFRKDVPDLMAALDVLVQPSRDPEACSMTILQAMFASKSVIATDVGGNKELVMDGKTGMLVPREDVAALTSAIADLAGNAPKRQSMGMAGQQRALERFTLQHQTSRFNQILWDAHVAAVRQR